MKACPKCQRVLPNEAGFCPEDGTSLVFISDAPAAISDDPRIGKRLCGRYELRRVIADGGMGRVYEGADKQTDTRIAVKILHASVAKDKVAIERFKREYELSSSLPHDYIVKVLDFQCEPETGVWFLVMDFLDGEELRYVLKREKTLPPERLIRMMSQVAIGLDEAHARKFVHRDLKPDNLFLCGTKDGDICKILDFGSVKDTNLGTKKLTVLGTTIGSPYYMAPEQAQGLDTLDARADVFALAALTYECVTGAIAFNGETGPAILLAIMTQDPTPPSIRGRDLPLPPPRALDDVIEHALTKNPNIRTPSVGAFANALGQAYGLVGDHHEWATTPHHDLKARIDEARARMPAAVEADPFAAPPGQAAGQAGMTAANPTANPFALATPGIGQFGLPGVSRPAWVMPVLIGLAVLLIGGLAMLGALLAR